MKKLFTLLSIAALLGFATPAASQPYTGYPLQLCTSESGNPGPCQWVQFLPGNSAGMGTIDYLPTAAAMYRWDATTSRFVRWDGTAGSATTPGVVRLMDGDSTVLADVLDTFADDLAATLNGQMSASVLYGYDGATFDRLTVGANSADNVLEATQGLNARTFLYGYDGTNWDRLYNASSADNLSSSLSGLQVISATHFYDGTNYRRWQGITMADNLTLPTAPFVGSVLLGYDGATLDMVRINASNAVEVADTSTRTGEDAANGLRWVGLKMTTEYDPAKTTTAGIGAAATTVLGPVDVSGYRRCCIYLQNDDGANSFTDADVKAGPDASTTDGDLGFTSCDTLAAGGLCSFCFDDAHMFIEAEVTGAGGATVDVDAWIHCTQ